MLTETNAEYSVEKEMEMDLEGADYIKAKIR